MAILSLLSQCIANLLLLPSFYLGCYTFLTFPASSCPHFLVLVDILSGDAEYLVEFFIPAKMPTLWKEF